MAVIRLIPVAVVISGLVACTSGGTAVARASVSPTSSTPASPAPPVGSCPVTLPAPVPATQPWRSQLFGSGSAFGNGSLWVGGLPEGGVLHPLNSEVGPGGAVSRKFGWWRAVPGDLTITARRLDAAAPPAHGDVPPGYGDQGFQSSGVTFPTPGCWEVTGSLATTHLTFVVLVLVP
ncbi:MAG: hypothetical protein ACM30G_21270 [Micromonosporaceae bacterium]